MIRRVIASAVLVALFWTGAVFPSGQDQAPYGTTVLKDVMVGMRDGVRLATDVYLPTRDGAILNERFPTILMRTPYGKGEVHGVGKYYSSYGYSAVIQDTRGRYNSEGVWHMLVDAGPDGYDTAEWIARQPWSNAKVGMIGTSYFGGTQHALAMNEHRRKVVAANTVYHDRDRPSHLLLPVIPTADRETELDGIRSTP